MENPEHQSNTEKPVSTHKTKMEQETAVSFLEALYIQNLLPIKIQVYGFME
jgi:hypothetical protein